MVQEKGFFFEAEDGIRDDKESRGQGDMYDRKPCIMIVPVMTLDDVKGWSGAGYDALVMAGPYGGTNIQRLFRNVHATSRNNSYLC